jgi:hypothetical protein
MIKVRVKTNEEFIGDLLAFSDHGGLIQIFIVEAIRSYSEQVASTPKPVEDGNGFISAIAWHGCATEVLQKMKENYESR